MTTIATDDPRERGDSTAPNLSPVSPADVRTILINDVVFAVPASVERETFASLFRSPRRHAVGERL